MAKRRRGRKNDADGNIVAILLVAVVLVIIITPIALFLGSLYFGLKLKNYKNILKGNLSDFWLDGDEKKEFKEISTVLTDANNAISDAKTTGRIKKVSINKDGSFSARSNLGKELRAIIEENEMIIGRYGDSFLDLVNLPQSRWKNFRNTFVGARSSFYGLFIWIILAAVAPLFFMGDYIKGIYTFYNFPFMLLQESTIPENTWQMMIVVTGGSLLIAAIVGILSSFSAKKITPYPPRVTEGNLYDY